MIPRHTLNNAVPFGERDGRMYEAKEVRRGLACECVCPACGEQLAARQGEVLAWHFAHWRPPGPQKACGRGGLETSLHKFTKQVLVESVGKVISVPKTNEGVGARWDSNMRVLRGWLETPIPNTNRRVDVLLEGNVRRIGPKDPLPWESAVMLGVEVCVTNPKTREYQAEVSRGSTWSIMELSISPEEVAKLLSNPALNVGWASAVRRLVLGRRRNRRWLFRRKR